MARGQVVAGQASRAACKLRSWCDKQSCRGRAVAAPNFDFGGHHHLSDHIDTTVEADDVQDIGRGAEDPLPPVLPIHPATGLITVDHRTLLHSSLNGRGFRQSLLANSLHNGVNPALTEAHPVQVFKRLLGALVAQMLFLPVVHHRGFQPRPKAACHFQPVRRFGDDRLLAIWTGDGVLAYFDHFTWAGRQFGDLVDRHQFPRFFFQGGLTMIAALRFQLNNVIRMLHKLALMLFMPFGRAMPLARFVPWPIALPIQRGRLRRVARIGRRFLQLLHLLAQHFIFALQLLLQGLQRFDLPELLHQQLDQVFSGQLAQFAFAHLTLSYQTASRSATRRE